MKVKDKQGKEVKADNQTKNKYASAYNHCCTANNINWKKPFYKIVEKTPLIPTPQDVQAIIGNSSEDYVAIFALEVEIGLPRRTLPSLTERHQQRAR